MSISLVADGRLWGLISCHHKTARTGSVRGCGRPAIFSASLPPSRSSRGSGWPRSGNAIALKRIETGLLGNLARADTFQAGLAENPSLWLALTGADRRGRGVRRGGASRGPDAASRAGSRISRPGCRPGRTGRCSRPIPSPRNGRTPRRSRPRRAGCWRFRFRSCIQATSCGFGRNWFTPSPGQATRENRR